MIVQYLQDVLFEKEQTSTSIPDGTEISDGIFLRVQQTPKRNHLQRQELTYLFF
jgi:hypothetical protein